MKARALASWWVAFYLTTMGRLYGATLRDLGITDIESQVYGAPQDRRRAYDPDWWRKK